MIRGGRTAAVLPWALLLVASGVYFFSDTEADNDLWGHVRIGRDVLAAGGPPRDDPYAYTTGGATWVDHEWLAQAAMALIFDGAGSSGLFVLKFLAGTATFGLVLHGVTARARAPWQWGAIGLLVAAVLARGFACRPQVFTYLAAAALLVVLRSPCAWGGRNLWILPPVFALWANLHGGFVLGLVVLGLAAAYATVRRQREARRLWLVTVLGALATTVNPYGPRLLAYIAAELRGPHPITEWQPPALTEPEHGAFVVLLVAVVATLPFRPQRRRFDWEIVLALGTAVMALQHQRHTPLLAITAAAPLAVQLRRAALWAERRGVAGLGVGARRVLAAGVTGLAGVQLALAAARLARDGPRLVYVTADYPVAAVAAMQAGGLRANLAVPLDWGAYVLYFLGPDVRVSLDGRFATIFPPTLVADNFAFFAGAPGWRRLLDVYPTDAALVPAGSPCPIASEPGWQRVWADPTATLYRRGDEPVLLPAVPPPPPRQVFP